MENYLMGSFLPPLYYQSIYCSEDWYPVGLRNWEKKRGGNPKYLLEAENGSCALAMTSGNFV
jgi:hypothetical protein